MSNAKGLRSLRPVKISPSILSANPLALGRQVYEVKDAGADLLHLDIMDGHFVPNLTFGPAVAKALGSIGLPLDIHLMISNPEWGIDAFCDYAEYITIHAEATPHLHRFLRLIREKGCRSGVALNPSTPPQVIEHVIDETDLVVIMTVNPGWGGQPFIPGMLRKIEQVRQIIDEAGLPVEIEVDGGITSDNSRCVIEKGADILVSGSYVFSSEHMAAAIGKLRGGTITTC